MSHSRLGRANSKSAHVRYAVESGSKHRQTRVPQGISICCPRRDSSSQTEATDHARYELGASPMTGDRERGF